MTVLDEFCARRETAIFTPDRQRACSNIQPIRLGRFDESSKSVPTTGLALSDNSGFGRWPRRITRAPAAAHARRLLPRSTIPQPRARKEPSPSKSATPSPSPSRTRPRTRRLPESAASSRRWRRRFPRPRVVFLAATADSGQRRLAVKREHLGLTRGRHEQRLTKFTARMFGARGYSRSTARQSSVPASAAMPLPPRRHPGRARRRAGRTRQRAANSS